MLAQRIQQVGGREKRAILVALGATTGALLLGRFSAGATPALALAVALVLVGGVLVALAPWVWMGVVVAILPFSDYAGDKIGLPYLLGTPARGILLLIIGVGIARRVLIPAASGPDTRNRRSTASQRVLLGIAGLFTALLGWSAIARSPSFVDVFAFGLDVFVLPVLAYWSLSSNLPGQKRIRALIWAASGSLAIQVAIGLYEYVTHSGVATFSTVEGPRVSFGVSTDIIGVRADGSFLRSEDFAIYCGAVAFLLMAYWLRRARWDLAFAMFCLGTAGSFSSGLRGVLIPFVLISAGVFVRSSGRKWRTLFVALSVIFVASVFVLPSVNLNDYGVYRERFKNTDSIYIRIASYGTAIAVFQEHPLTGVGFGNYAAEAKRADNVRFFRGSASIPYTHNSFLALLADAGVIGGALYIGLYWGVLKRQQESGSFAVEAGTPIILLFLAVGLSLNVGYQSTPVAIVLLLAGLAHIMSPDASERRRSSRQLTRAGASALTNARLVAVGTERAGGPT